jgi:putative methionine-R-sulfoxide reductase with GAF domain
LYGSAQPDVPDDHEKTSGDAPRLDRATSSTNPNRQSLAERELDAALQLLVERSQYLTGATGVALALPSGDDMICRASVGSSAPPAGARLQVQSGLTGESIAARQLLRCDDAEHDPRVNLETCREMGIASIVVLPLLRNGEVCGLFELFSDHAHAFEEPDLTALQRMADLTLTALDLGTSRPAPVASFVRDRIASGHVAPDRKPENASDEKTRDVAVVPAEEPIPAVASHPPNPVAEVPDLAVPEAMARVQKCAACGFPVSEGRTYCLDCEKKEARSPDSSQPATEFVPAFLTTAVPKESWLANHVNLLAIVVLILGILVAIVVFR